MKIGILTFHYAHNYGALMQAWALKEYLQSIGHEVYFIDYKNQKIKQEYKIFHSKKSNNKESLNKIIIHKLVYPIRIIKKIIRSQRFHSFIQKELPRLKPTLIKSMNVVIVGSDQVWNSKLTDGYDTFYWGMKQYPNLRYISYASSMNADITTEKEKKEISKLLKNFSHISVRESNLVQQLSPLTNTPINFVGDPTILINNKVWNKIINPKYVPSFKYVLAYPLRDGKEVIDIARKVAKEKKLQLIILSGEVLLKPSANEFTTKGPYEFISLLKFAEYVVTSSFHGTILSIIHHKEFVTIKCKDGNNLRVSSILDYLNLNKRLVNSYESIKQLEEINYNTVDTHLKQLQNLSFDFINKSLNNL
jgi:hypothetical protein